MAVEKRVRFKSWWLPWVLVAPQLAVILVFDFRLELFAMIDSYLGLLMTKQVDFPEGYHEVLREAEAVREAHAAHPVPVVAGHCDVIYKAMCDLL